VTLGSDKCSTRAEEPPEGDQHDADASVGDGKLLSAAGSDDRETKRPRMADKKVDIADKVCMPRLNRRCCQAH
jgi:hypothetical protein